MIIQFSAEVTVSIIILSLIINHKCDKRARNDYFVVTACAYSTVIQEINIIIRSITPCGGDHHIENTGPWRQHRPTRKKLPPPPRHIIRLPLSPSAPHSSTRAVETHELYVRIYSRRRGHVIVQPPVHPVRRIHTPALYRLL